MINGSDKPFDMFPKLGEFENLMIKSLFFHENIVKKFQINKDLHIIYNKNVISIEFVIDGYLSVYLEDGISVLITTLG